MPTVTIPCGCCGGAFCCPDTCDDCDSALTAVASCFDDAALITRTQTYAIAPLDGFGGCVYGDDFGLFILECVEDECFSSTDLPRWHALVSSLCSQGSEWFSEPVACPGSATTWTGGVPADVLTVTP